MKIRIIATRSCSHCAGLQRELQDLGYDYELCYVEECPDIVARYDIRHSPNQMVNDRIVCRGPLSEGELRALIEGAR